MEGRIDFGSDGKLASKLGKEMEKANKDASFALFTADEAAGHARAEARSTPPR